MCIVFTMLCMKRAKSFVYVCILRGNTEISGLYTNCVSSRTTSLDIGSILKMCLWKRQAKQLTTSISILTSSGVFNAILASLLFSLYEILKVYYFP